MEMIAQVKYFGLKASLAYLLVILVQPIAKSQNLAKATSVEEKTDTVDQAIATLVSVDSASQNSSTSIPQLVEIKPIITKLPESLVIDQFKCIESTISLTYNSKVKTFITQYT